VPVSQGADGAVQAVVVMVFSFKPVKASAVRQQSQDGRQLGGFEGFRIGLFGVRGRGGS
jgi:hypothetical protein